MATNATTTTGTDSSHFAAHPARSAPHTPTVSNARADTEIYTLSNLNNVGSVEVNAFQVHSAAVIQKSIKEGFGLTVTEALWKTRPTVAGRVQILRDPQEARQRALRGKEFVRRHFLTPRLLRDWLVLMNRLLGNDTSGAEVPVVAAV